MIILTAGSLHNVAAGTSDWKYYYEKGMIQFRAEMYMFAMENFSKALDRNPVLFDAANRIADIHIISNRKREALEFYTLSLKINDRQADIHNQAGELDEFFGYYEKAFSHYNASVGVDPQYLKARLNIVRNLVRKKEYALADEQFRICYEKGKAEGDNYFKAAVDEERRGRTKEAVNLYLTALEKNPVMIETLFSLAEISRRGNDLDGAIRYLEKIKEIKPDYEKAYVYLGHIYFSRRYVKDRKYILNLAVRNFEKAAELNPGNTETLTILSEVYRFMGNDVKADELLKKASEKLTP